MDASASQKVDTNSNDVYSFYIKVKNPDQPAAPRQRSGIIKYTKLPEFEFESLGPWPRTSYSLQPRLRRIITLEEPGIATDRSLKPDLLIPSKDMTTNNSKRKIVTISEDDENDLHPKFSNNQVTKKSYRKPTISKSVYVDFDKESKQTSQKTTARQVASPGCRKETKTSVKGYNTAEKKEVINKLNNKTTSSNIKKDFARSRHVKDKDSVKSSKGFAPSKNNISKNYLKPSESEKEMNYIQSKLYENLPPTRTKKNISKSKLSRSPSPNKSKASFKEQKSNNKPYQTVIHVPLEEKILRTNDNKISRHYICAEKLVKSDPLDNSNLVVHNDVNITTEPFPITIDQGTYMDEFQSEVIKRCVQDTDVQTELDKETIDSLDIPNVSLKKDRRDNEINNVLQSQSLPNLQIPPCQIAPSRNENSFLDTHYYKSTSYIISRATLTYKTKQKINFHVVGSNDNTYSNQALSPLSYPMNVVSVFKEESSTKDITNNISMEEEHKNKSDKEFKNCINEIKSLDCSYVSDSNKLMKPSDIISTITINNGLLQSDFICEQFQRELNFIDSFFESLQYLESCTFADKCFKDDKINVLVNQSSILSSPFDVKDTEYENFLSKFENSANCDDSETIASKNLLLLNILIRDEQRRAKNLLFVLKRREDALKDFTKSQILYLESKKKQDNTDISALKKKQRGALLKLQHECGEMQRMRKALLTLSEKRKVALMKTKKDLELKLRNNVDVDQIILGKKKLKRNASGDRASAPLKCFDLSSSGCEDSTTSRGSPDSTSSPSETPIHAKFTTGVEKSIQTGDSILERPSIDQSTNTTAENFVVVDGGYLNILFQNLTLPQIFSGGKQYEVNEEALKNIVSTTNKSHKEKGSDIVEKLMDQINHCESNLDKSSSPSTARSLVEEFDQYYKGLAEDEKSFEDDSGSYTPAQVYEINEAAVQVTESMVPCHTQSLSTMTSESLETVVHNAFSSDDACDCEVRDQPTCPLVSCPPTGPLLPPVGEDPPAPLMEVSSWQPLESSLYTPESSASSESLCELGSSVSSLVAPVHTEAEELRRQQLAIEQEIKELEQQQCRLLVVREIPDKPPPPYTAPRSPRPFRPDNVDSLVRAVITDPSSAPPSNDPFDVFVQDFCLDSLERLKPELSDKPWDSCNILPQIPPPDIEKVIESTSSDLIDVLSGVKPVVVSGVSSRRSDHIDDILFAEWRRIEPQWTSLHTDESVVKNQLFETIFQRILTATVDEYKQTVLQLSD